MQQRVSLAATPDGHHQGTPTEAGAGGALLAMAIAGSQRRLNLRVIRTSVLEAVTTTASLLFVAYGAVMFSKFLALSMLPVYLGDMIRAMELSPYELVLAASLIYLILGMFLDPLGVLLLSLPIMQPMFAAAGADPIWLGVIVVKFIEIGLLTPPVGFNVYVVKSVVGDTIPLGTIFRGVGWFLACEVVIMTLLVIYPQISLFLPNNM